MSNKETFPNYIGQSGVLCGWTCRVCKGTVATQFLYSAPPNPAICETCLFKLNELINPNKQSKTPKPEWEIVEFRNPYNYPIVKNTEGLWYLPNIQGGRPCSYDDVLSSVGSGNSIYSVKRTSDGEVFRLGDKIQHRESDDCKWQGSAKIISLSTNKVNDPFVEMYEDDETNPAGSIVRELSDIRHLTPHTPSKPEQPKRIVVTEMWDLNNSYQEQFTRHGYRTSSPVPEDKFPLIKEAIERVLNDEGVKDEFDSPPMFSRPDFDNRLKEVEKKAFEEGRRVQIERFMETFFVHPDYNHWVLNRK